MMVYHHPERFPNGDVRHVCSSRKGGIITTKVRDIVYCHYHLLMRFINFFLKGRGVLRLTDAARPIHEEFTRSHGIIHC